MNIDRWILRIGSSFILASLLLAYFFSPAWLWFTAFVGANLFQSSFTGWCPMVVLLRRLGVKPGQAFS